MCGLGNGYFAATMATVDSFSLEGGLEVKATQEDDVALISMQLEGAGVVKGDNQMLFSMDIKTSGFTSTLTFETREVQGVSYTQYPLTSEWEIDDSDDPKVDSFEEFDGTLGMAHVYWGLVASELPPMEVQSLYGLYPDNGTEFKAGTALHPDLEEIVLEATGGAVVSFDVALMRYVLPGWIRRMGGADDPIIQVFNEKVGPLVGLRINPDGTVVKTR